MPEQLEIADALVDELNGHSFALAFTAARTILPVTNLADLATLKVSVYPRSHTEESASRKFTLFEYLTDVAVQQRVKDLEPATTAPLFALMEAVADFLRRIIPTGYPTARWSKTDVVGPLQEHFEKHRSFTGILTFHHQVLR